MPRVGLWYLTLAFPGNTSFLLNPWLHSDPEGEIDLNGQFMMPYFTPTDLFRHFSHIIKSIKPEIFNFLLIGFTLILSLAVHECACLV